MIDVELLVSDIIRSVLIFLGTYFSMVGQERFEKRRLIKAGILTLILAIASAGVSIVFSLFITKGQEGVPVLFYNVAQYAICYGLPLLFAFMCFDFKHKATVFFYYAIVFFATRLGNQLMRLIAYASYAEFNELIAAFVKIGLVGLWLLLLYLLRKKNHLCEQVEGLAIVLSSFLNTTIVLTILTYAQTLLEAHGERTFAILVYFAELFVTVVYLTIVGLTFSMVRKQSEERVLKS
ncbi:MAG: hypothetical protein K6B65_01460, partial [Bacilli bacterium]|nr:hypothetical protein [Bacilli bacterium]